MVEGLSEWKARDAAEARGFPVSHGQFKEYLRRGLIWKLESGRWPAETADRLVRIRELGEDIRSLPRRVILLQGESPLFKIPVQQVRKAMIETLPTIKAPKRKMARVDKAMAWWAKRLQGSPQPRLDAVVLPQDWRTPPFDCWKATLSNEEISLDSLATTVWAQFHVARAVLPVYTNGTAYDLHDLPLEEQIILLTVRDVSISLRLRERNAEQEAGANQ